MNTPDSKYEIVSYIFNSNNRNNGSIANPSFVLGETFNIKGVKVKNAMLGFSVYPISSRNNQIYFIEQTAGNTVKNCSIAQGYYTGSSLATEIATKMSGAGTQTYTVSYSSATNKLTISAAANFLFTTGNNNANYECGLLNNTSYDTSQTTDQIDVSGVKMINVISNIGAINVIGSQKSILCSIPNNAANLAVNLYSDNSGDYINLSAGISELTFYLQDERMRDLTSIDKDWSLQLNFLVE